MTFIRSARRAFAAGAVVAFPLLAPAAGAAPVPVTFAGGGGSPLTIGLPYPVSYTAVRASAPGSGVQFVFRNVGNAFDTYQRNVAGTLTYTINGGPPQAVTLGATGTAFASVGADDLRLYQFNGGPSVAAGDVIVLSAGSATTTQSTSFRPVSGEYDTFLADAYGAQIGTGVPEPASAGVLAAAAAAGLLRRRRR